MEAILDGIYREHGAKWYSEVIDNINFMLSVMSNSDMNGV